MNYRKEKDSMGEVLVESDKLWGAQTERSRQNFVIGKEKMPMELIYAIARVKQASALSNVQSNKLDKKKCDAIIKVCEKIYSGDLDDSFPLSLWQTGSGTQTNMNVNEVIANFSSFNLDCPLHPNDDVNMSQSSNDVFPTAMHIAIREMIFSELIPNLNKLIESFQKLEKENENIRKIGRTHLQDATPITFGEELGGFRSALEIDRDFLIEGCDKLKYLAIGGTAVGNGINAPKNFDKLVCQNLKSPNGLTYEGATNKFASLSHKNTITFVHGILKTLSSDMMKIANDIRWLASGPRCGLGEITIPSNEPGSSIMPGKVNPTQCEAVTMVAVQVMGNDVTISQASSLGNFQLNVFMPVIVFNALQSINILSSSIKSFNDNCVVGIKANAKRMKENLNKSLMLVTYLTPTLGYEKSAKIAKFAFENDLTVEKACEKLGENFPKNIVF